jgi:hypothetical protein
MATGSRYMMLALATRPPAPKVNPKAALVAKAVLAAVDEFVIPAYRALADATEAQEKAWTAFAVKRDTGDFESLRAAYNAVCDAWAEVQIVKTGPISLFLRYDRFSYWPEARNVTQRTLDQLLASNDPKDLAPETLAHDSVAAQGLTALERLLYDGDNPARALKAPGKAGTWRTQVGLGIAHNLSIIAADVLADWTAPDGVREAIAASKAWKTIFADAQEAARLLLTDVVSGFKLMHDVKILPVLGANAGVAKPKSAESWRSGRTQRDLMHNLAGAHAITTPFGLAVPAAHWEKLNRLFADADRIVRAMPADMGEAAADPMRRPLVEAARAAIKAVQTEIATVLPADLGITLGFNSLDGD